MKNILSTKQKSLTVLVSVLISVSLAALSVFAGTTIGTNITTEGEARFLELAANGTEYVGLKAPSSIGTSLVWTLPSTDGSANQTLVTDGSGALSWASGLTTALTSGNIFVGNASNVATSVTMSGDATLSNTGVLTIASDAVTAAKIAQGTAGQILMSDATPDAAWTTMTGDVTIDSAGATTIGADKVALTTDTTGNYVASLTAGNGIAVGAAGEGATPSVALSALTSDWSQSGAFDVALANASSELKIMESAGDTYYGIFDVTNLTADRTYTFPDATGAVVTTGDTGTVTSAMIGSDIANADIDASAAIAYSKLAPLPDTYLLVGNGSNVATAVAMSGDATIANTGAVTLATAQKKGIETVLMSFETGEQTATKIYFPFGVTIDKIRGTVMKAIAGTDNGTITGANATGDSSGGVITATASDALNTEYSATPTTNNTVAADSYYKLTSAKATAGGKVLVTLEYTRD